MFDASMIECGLVCLAFVVPTVAYSFGLFLLFVFCLSSFVLTFLSFRKRFRVECTREKGCRVVRQVVVRQVDRADVEEDDVHQIANELLDIVAEMRVS